jgi:hypothetical protein
LHRLIWHVKVGVVISKKACKRKLSTYCGTIGLKDEGSPLLLCSYQPGGSRRLSGSHKLLLKHSVVHLLLGPVFIGNAELWTTTNSAGILLDRKRFLLLMGRLCRLVFEYKIFVRLSWDSLQQYLYIPTSDFSSSLGNCENQ